jgi:hypothetical protein
MPKVVITHKVADVEKWLTFKSERAAAVGSLGGTNIVDHAEVGGGNDVAITCEIDDIDSALNAVRSPSPELGAEMQKHGVVPPLTIFVAR